MLVVIACDIPSDRRRARMHALLSGYGEPVQRRVFECDLEDAALRKLRARLGRMIRRADSVRLYPRCAACAERDEDGLGGRPARQPGVYIA
jgi:CRISPR-associated protein Cas2